ncbi:hypothetical protein Tco_1077629 [Tanacetum coccineum]
MGMDPTIRLQRESKKTCCQSGHSGTLFGQGSVVIVTASADYLLRMSTNPLMVCESGLPPESSIFTACGVMLRAVNVTRLRFLADVFEYFRINLSQLSVIAATKISHFEILCRVYGYAPTVGLFRRFYVNSKNKEIDLFAFIHHADPTKNVGRDDPNEESGNADQEDRSEGNDHVGQDEATTILVDAEVQAAVADKHKGKRKKRRATGGASGSNHPPKQLREDHGTSETGLVAAATVPFITSFVTPMAEHEEGGDTDSISGPNLRTQHPSKMFVIYSESSHHSSTNDADAEVASFVRSSVPLPPVMTAAVTTTVTVDASSAPILRAGAELATQVYQSLFTDSASIGATGPDIAGPSHPAGTELSAYTFYVSQEMDSEALCQIYVPKWNVVIESVLDDPDVCRRSVDQLAPPGFFPSFAGEERLEGRCARQVDLMKEKDAEIANLKAQLSLREAEAIEAIHLRSQVYVVEAAEATRVSELNSLKEQNIAFEKENNTLEGHVVTLESVAATKDTELASLNAQTAKLTQDLSSLQLFYDELSIKAASLGSQKDGLIDQVKELSDRVAGLDSELMALALHLDEEFYPRIQTRLVAGIDHKKAERGLADVVAYDPSVEARYVSAVLAFRDMDFNLLSQLESQKDASIADIMNSLRLEGPSAKTPETSLSNSLNVVHDHVQKLKEGAISYHTSICDATPFLVDPLSSENLIGEASTSKVPATAAATTTLSISVTATSASSIPPILVADYDVLDARIQGEVPHSPKIVFEKETLETTPERPMTI